MLLISDGLFQLILSLPAAGLTFVSTKVSKTICGTELGIHASNNCATASLQSKSRVAILDVPLNKILQQLQTHLLTFFRVKLHSK